LNSCIVQNIAWAVSRVELPEARRRVLIEVARAAFSQQTFVIPELDLARLARVSRADVREHLAALQREGFLARLECVGGMVVSGRLAYHPMARLPAEAAPSER
jgi:DNA-binding GntR family transcriptional regulator